MGDRHSVFTKRALGIVIVLSILLPMISCNKNNVGNGKRKSVVSKNDSWFEGELVDVDVKQGLNPDRRLYTMSPKLAGADEKYIVILAAGEYQVNDWGTIKHNSDFAIRNLLLIDRATKKTIKIINLYNLLKPGDWVNAASYKDGTATVRAESWDSKAQRSIDREYTIDIETETVTGFIDYGGIDDFWFRGSYKVGNYKIDSLYRYMVDANENRYWLLRITSPDGNQTEITFEDQDERYDELPSIFALDDRTALVPIYSGREYVFYKLDLTSCKATKVDSKAYQWLDLNKLRRSSNGSDGKVYFTTRRGISSLDFENKNAKQVFDFNNCNVNRRYMEDLEIAECSGDSFLFCGSYDSLDMRSSKFVKNFAVVELKKAKKNPHAGKKIIELCSYDGYLNGTLYDAIIKYNESNSDYHIEFSDRYIMNDYSDFGDINTSDDYESALLGANGKLSDVLAMDIMNGTGPDIIMNTSRLGQLNSDNLLIDLSIYTQELDSSKYYTNIINGAKTGGKLYQIPISYTIEGIQTSPENAGKSKIGFTPEEYKKFISEELNGEDLIESGQALYFTKLFTGMSDEFISGGRVNFSSSKFADIAGYVKETVPRNSAAWNTITDETQQDSYETATKGIRTAIYCNCPGISGYLIKRYQIKDGTTILGLPSSDGRGPMFGTDTSVAISKNAVNIDACVEFVKMLLSDEVQEDLAMNDKFVLNREAFKKSCSAVIEYYNSPAGADNLFDYEIGTNVPRRSKFQDEEIDNMENIILSCSKSNSSDAAISTILMEEMPAYFLGQKDLDAVIKIAQDRAQKVLDERG